MPVVEFIGSPAAGKSSVSRQIASSQCQAKEDCLLLPDDLDFFTDILPSLTLFDNVKSWLLVADIIILTIFIRRNRPDSFPEWFSWLRRIRMEWRNCTAYAQKIRNMSLGDRMVLCDSTIAGGFLMEVADPRNPLGTALLPKALHWLGRIPMLPSAVAVITVPPEMAIERESRRTTNRVRLFLTDRQRTQFFRNAHALSQDIFHFYSSQGIPSLIVSTGSESLDNCSQTITDFIKKATKSNPIKDER